MPWQMRHSQQAVRPTLPAWQQQPLQRQRTGCRTAWKRHARVTGTACSTYRELLAVQGQQIGCCRAAHSLAPAHGDL